MDIKLEDERLNRGKLRYKHLLGRPFKMGEYDCYRILMDVYKDNLNIQLTDYVRPTDWWLTDGLDFYKQHYPAEGFRALNDFTVSDLRPFDVLLIAIPDPRNMKKVVTNHCAIYLGDGQILHHRMGYLSCVEEYRGTLRNLTTHVIRHKDVPPNLGKNATTKLDLMELIPPHKRAILQDAQKKLKEAQDAANTE